MADEEFQKVKAIFQAVLEMEPKKRAAFLDKTCRDDAELRREVESLLSNHESGFMEKPAVEYVADLVVNEESLAAGEKIGRFEIISLLGKGGMGEVYLAHDKSLGRDVAIKVLLPKFTSDRERVNRFKLEAKAASALNHPNIITIHEVGEDNDRLFIATEHINGETLRSLIHHRSLTLGSAIKIAEQIASALTAAHKAGIIHRDIKPENIMVREDGFVKVLDFGLAKPTIVDVNAETRDFVETKEGLIMGSVSYMSPEQARGHHVDARTDLWSIGVVFYEMLTGKAPFQADTMTDVLANIIHKEPVPIAEYIPDVPTELYRIVKKSFRKDADERYQNAKDLSLDLRNLRREMELEHELELSVSPQRLQEIRSKSNEIQQTADKQKETNELQETKILSAPIVTQTSGEAPRPKSKYKTAAFAILGILIIGGLSYFGYSYLKPKKLSNTAFKNTTIQKLSITGTIDSIALSPDGKYLAYVAGGAGQKMRLILRQQVAASEKEIQVTENSLLLLSGFSADGNYFYYVSFGFNDVGTLYQVPILGGEPKKIVDDIDSDASFLPNGYEFVFGRHSFDPEKDNIILFNIQTGQEKLVYSSEKIGLSSLDVSPDGEKIAFFAWDGAFKLAWISINGGEPTLIGKESWASGVIRDISWLSDGSGIVCLGKSINGEDTKIFLADIASGNLVSLTNDISSYHGLALSYDNKMIATIQSVTTTGIWDFDIVGRASKQIKGNTSGNSGLAGIDVKPDNQIIYSKADGKGNTDLWRINLDGTDDCVFLSLGKKIALNTRAEWGDGIYLQVSDEKSQKIWKVNLDGTNSVQITNGENYFERLIGVMPENKTLLFQRWEKNENWSGIYEMSMVDGNVSPLLVDKNVFIFSTNLAPNAKRLSYVYCLLDSPDGCSKNKLALVDFDGTKLVNPKIFDEFPVFSTARFSNDGKNLLLTKSENRSDIWQMDLTNGKTTKITDFNHDTIYNFAVSGDGKKLYMVRGNTTDEVVFIKSAE